MTHDTLIRAWGFALRDLCEQGALTVTAVMPGGLSFTYSDGSLLVSAAGDSHVFRDEDLDDVGLAVADAMSSKQHWNGVRDA